MYDSTEDTTHHINTVSILLSAIAFRIRERARVHDASKLLPPEKEAFDTFTPQLRDLTYGSPEYAACLEAMRPALEHHYQANSHHPEHYENGIDDMDLLDLIEMLADWRAATMRHADGDLRKSLEINRKRFHISEQLHGILLLTAHRLGWLDERPAEPAA